MPGFAADDVQRSTVGSAGAHALREAFNFFSAVKRYAERSWTSAHPQYRSPRFRVRLGSHPSLLSQGLQSGQPPRHRRRPGAGGYLPQHDELRQFRCRRPAAPDSFPDESFDIVVGYSVFSHLAEHASIAWVKEIARLLRPRGIMIVTTEPRDFIELCRSLREGLMNSPGTRPWLIHSSTRKRRTAPMMPASTSYAPTGGGSYRPADFYGEALIPEGYVRARWTEFLRFVDFVGDPPKSFPRRSSSCRRTEAWTVRSGVRFAPHVIREPRGRDESVYYVNPGPFRSPRASPSMPGGRCSGCSWNRCAPDRRPACSTWA